MGCSSSKQADGVEQPRVKRDIVAEDEGVPTREGGGMPSPAKATKILRAVENQNLQVSSPKKKQPEAPVSRTPTKSPGKTAPVEPSKNKFEQLRVEIPPNSERVEPMEAPVEKKENAAPAPNTKDESSDVVAFRSKEQSPMKKTPAVRTVREEITGGVMQSERSEVISDVIDMGEDEEVSKKNASKASLKPAVSFAEVTEDSKPPSPKKDVSVPIDEQPVRPLGQMWIPPELMDNSSMKVPKQSAQKLAPLSAVSHKREKSTSSSATALSSGTDVAQDVEEENSDIEPESPGDHAELQSWNSYRNGRFKKFKEGMPKGAKPSIYRLSNTHHLITKIYKAKVKADKADTREGKPVSSLNDYVQVYFEQKYGQSPFTMKKLISFLKSVHLHAKKGESHKCVLFVRFLGLYNPFDLESLSKFLQLYNEHRDGIIKDSDQTHWVREAVAEEISDGLVGTAEFKALNRRDLKEDLGAVNWDALMIAFLG